MESPVAHASRRALRALLSMRCLCFNGIDLILRRPPLEYLGVNCTVVSSRAE
jgi:hypothetical protein